MGHLAVKIAVIESEAGWGRKVDDYMVCLSIEEAKKFEKEFNSKNTSKTVPDWYMQAEGEPIPVDLSDKQFKYLNKGKTKREWWSTLKDIK